MVCTTVTTPNSTFFGHITHAKYGMEIHCLVYKYTTIYVTSADLVHKQKIFSKKVANSMSCYL